MERIKMKVQICTLLSDLGVVGKIPCGRTDWLVDNFENIPEFFREAVMTRPIKGSKTWRLARDYAMELKVPDSRRDLQDTSRDAKTSKGISTKAGHSSGSGGV